MGYQLELVLRNAVGAVLKPRIIRRFAARMGRSSILTVCRPLADEAEHIHKALSGASTTLIQAHPALKLGKATITAQRVEIGVHFQELHNV
jgi:hypothetical protein